MSVYPAYLNAYLTGIIKTGEEKARTTESGSLDIRSNMSLKLFKDVKVSFLPCCAISTVLTCASFVVMLGGRGSQAI